MNGKNKTNRRFNTSRDSLCRFVFICVLLLLIYDAVSHTLLTQLQAPVIVYPYVDVTYLLFNLSHLNNLLTANFFIAVCFNVFMYAGCIAAIIFPSKKIFILAFFILYFLYFLIYNDYGAHHIHSKVGILLIPIPFLFADKDFLFVWNALRYYTLFIYADSFLWKLFRKSWANNRQGIAILKENIIPLLYAHPNYKAAGLYYYFLEHPAYADVLYKTGFVLEGLFIVGFFTKRFDAYLIIISVLLAAGFWYTADAFAFELLILDFTLLFNYRSKRTKTAS